MSPTSQFYYLSYYLTQFNCSIISWREVFEIEIIRNLNWKKCWKFYLGIGCRTLEKLWKDYCGMRDNKRFQWKRQIIIYNIGGMTMEYLCRLETHVSFILFYPEYILQYHFNQVEWRSSMGWHTTIIHTR